MARVSSSKYRNFGLEVDPGAGARVRPLAPVAIVEDILRPPGLVCQNRHVPHVPRRRAHRMFVVFHDEQNGQPMLCAELDALVGYPGLARHLAEEADDLVRPTLLLDAHGETDGN